jgi:hypothetical protein
MRELSICGSMSNAPAVRRMYIPSRTSIEALMNVTGILPAIPAERRALDRTGLFVDIEEQHRH